MVSPYEKLNFFYINGVPFLPLAKRGKAVNCRIGLSRQLVFIPAKYFDITEDNISLKPKADLSWFINKPDTKRKIQLYKEDKVNYEEY